MDMALPDESVRRSNNLLGDGYLRRGGIGLVCGPTGVGKSSWSMQAAVSWALGRKAFGINPESALRVLVVQSENDDIEVVEMRDGVVSGLGLTPQEMALVRSNVRVLRAFRSGLEWLEDLRTEIEAFPADIVLADPLFAYAGVPVSDQAGVTQFLRESVTPFAIEKGLGIIFLHHTNKPPRESANKNPWRGSDLSYAMSGHNELANVPRFVIVLKNRGTRSVFEMVLAKRWKRAGVRDSEGQPTSSVLLKHAEVGVFWHEASEADLRKATLKDAESQLTEKSVVRDMEKLSKAFFSISEGGEPVPLKQLAKKAGCASRTVYRWFDGGDPVEYKGHTFIRQKGMISAIPTEEEAVHE